MVASGSDKASDALEPGGEWNAYVRAIAGFMSGVAPEGISATDYLAHDDASTGKNWNLPLGYGTLVASSLPPEVLCLATPFERIDLTADGVLPLGRNAAFESDSHAYGNLRDARSAAYSIRPAGATPKREHGWPARSRTGCSSQGRPESPPGA